MTYHKNHYNLDGVKELVIPPDGVKRKLDGLVDSVLLTSVMKCLMES